MFAKWKLGGYALGVLQLAGDVARSIDPEAALKLARMLFMQRVSPRCSAARTACRVYA